MGAFRGTSFYRRWITERWPAWPAIGLAVRGRAIGRVQCLLGRRAASGAAKPIYCPSSGAPPGRQPPLPIGPALGGAQPCFSPPKQELKVNLALGGGGHEHGLSVYSVFVCEHERAWERNRFVLVRRKCARSEFAYLFEQECAPERKRVFLTNVVRFLSSNGDVGICPASPWSSISSEIRTLFCFFARLQPQRTRRRNKKYDFAPRAQSGTRVFGGLRFKPKW